MLQPFKCICLNSTRITSDHSEARFPPLPAPQIKTTFGISRNFQVGSLKPAIWQEFEIPGIIGFWRDVLVALERLFCYMVGCLAESRTIYGVIEDGKKN